MLLATVMVTAWGVMVDAQRRRSTPCPTCRTCRSSSARRIPGQAPQIVENQVTYPLTTTMLSVPGAKTVRGYSLFGDSFVYILFEDGTDLYWARSRVLEYLNQVQSRLPAQAKAALGPDATGVGWIYEYALVDRTGQHGPVAAARAAGLVPQVRAEDGAQRRRSGERRRHGAPVPDRARSRPAARVQHPAYEGDGRGAQGQPGNRRLGAGTRRSRIHGARSGYLQSLDDFRKIPLTTTDAGVSVRLGDVARIQIGPEMRRGIAELNGEGEVAGGMIVMRSGKNALETIDAVKAKLAEAQAEPAAGRRDRSGLRPLQSHRARGREPDATS